MTKAIELLPNADACDIENMRHDIAELSRVLKETSDLPAPRTLNLGACNFIYLWDKTFFIRQWPETSGCDSFPVKSTVECMSDKDMYCHGKAHKWDRTTKYGAARRRLARFLISCFEQQIEAYEA